MVRVYRFVAITYIINRLFDNESTKTSNGYARCWYVGKESSQNFLKSGKLIIQPYNMWVLRKSNTKEHVYCFTL